MRKPLSLVACALLVAGLAACNADKGPADVAIKAADQEITAAAPEAEKYVPEQLTAAKDALKAAQDQFAKGDYKGALAAATELGVKAKELATAAAAKKDELTKAWNDLAASLPQSVAAIQAKIEELGKAKKLPKGMDKAALTQAQEGLAGITKSWEEASAAFTAGNLTDALAKAGGLKEKGAEVMALLGMAPPAAPAETPAETPAAPAK
jgi:hypothetical protein